MADVVRGVFARRREWLEALRPIALAALMAAGINAWLPLVRAGDDVQDRLTLAVDALTRLEGIDLSANPTMKERVLAVLAKTRGTANFVRLVRHFSLEDQEAGLVEVAAALPKDEHGVEAIRLLLGKGRTNLLATALAQGGARSEALIEALGNSGHRVATRLLLPTLSVMRTGGDQTRGDDASHSTIRALARSLEGATELLRVLKAGELNDPLRKLALDELAQTRWAQIKTDAIQLRGQTVVKWPTIPELIGMRGERERGQSIYYRASPGCFNCHVVHGKGTDLGPNLSEIGSKLPKEALFQAILEPSAGISFGYEAFTITLRDGEEAYGLVASETPTELAIKSVGGVITRYKKSEVVSRQKATVSLMPAGLEAGVTPQELVDLVEFLSSLKKPGLN
jgi:putative heme-binding domain-containing protein